LLEEERREDDADFDDAARVGVRRFDVVDFDFDFGLDLDFDEEEADRLVVDFPADFLPDLPADLPPPDLRDAMSDSFAAVPVCFASAIPQRPR
jgi:hypothetical protein